MTPSSVPVRDRAALSARTRDHLHQVTAPVTRIDLVSLGADIVFCFLGVVVTGGLCLLAAFGFLDSDHEETFVPRALLGPEKYEMFWWLVFAVTMALGMWGLRAFWLKRMWVKAYGSKKQVWTGGHALQIFLGTLMPLGGLAMLWSHPAASALSWWGILFSVAGVLYLRHAIQVFLWSRA